MSDVRVCPACSQPVQWCDSWLCHTWLLPRGHWDHRGSAIDCPNLGDRNRDPDGQPDTPRTRHPELFDAI